MTPELHTVLPPPHPLTLASEWYSHVLLHQSCYLKQTFNRFFLKRRMGICTASPPLYKLTSWFGEGAGCQYSTSLRTCPLGQGPGNSLQPR